MKRFVAFLLALCMVFTMCACAKEEKPLDSTVEPSKVETEEAEKVEETEEEITLVWVSYDKLVNDRAEKTLAKWEKLHPNVKIEYIDLQDPGDGSFEQTIDTMVAAGKQVDVCKAYAATIGTYAQNGAALPLDEYIQAAGDDFYEMYDSYTVDTLKGSDGKIYGIPQYDNTFKVFYNKTMTDAAGIEIPESWTLEEYLEIAKKLNDPENGVWGSVLPLVGGNYLDLVPALLDGWTVCKWDENGNAVPNFDDARFKESLQFIRDLSLEHNVIPTYNQRVSESLNPRLMLATGQTAMIWNGVWTMVWLQKYMYDGGGAGPLDFELGVTEIPYASENAKNISYYEGAAECLYVPSTSKYPQWAYEFAKFVANDAAVECDMYMPSYLGADKEAAALTLNTYIDDQGNLHEDLFDEDVLIKTFSVPGERHNSYWQADPALAPYTTAVWQVYTEQYGLFMSGEMEMDEFVDLLQTLGADAIATMN